MATTPSRLISGSNIAGTAVYDDHGKKLGHIDDVMIDKSTGRVVYAVLAAGGFFGINDKHHPLPWTALRYDPTLDGYVVAISQDVLTGAPAYEVDSKPDWDDSGWGQVDDHYRARPTDQDVPLDATSSAR
jgi:sporulation protein YlmC with PRC-barrel domain